MHSKMFEQFLIYISEKTKMFLTQIILFSPEIVVKNMAGLMSIPITGMKTRRLGPICSPATPGQTKGGKSPPTLISLMIQALPSMFQGRLRIYNMFFLPTKIIAFRI